MLTYLHPTHHQCPGINGQDLHSSFQVDSSLSAICRNWALLVKVGPIYMMLLLVDDRSSKINFQVCALLTLVSGDFALFLEHEPLISSVLSELGM